MTALIPRYLELLATGELKSRVTALEALLERCTVCPRDCFNDRRMSDEVLPSVRPWKTFVVFLDPIWLEYHAVAGLDEGGRQGEGVEGLLGGMNYGFRAAIMFRAGKGGHPRRSRHLFER